MSDRLKVVWSEGLFLRPQHFQQQERYLEAFVEGRAGGLRSYSWGFLELEIERELLATGKLALRRARGVFPDGTPFSMPDHDALPSPLDVGRDVRDRTVHLAIPLRRPGALDSARDDRGAALARNEVRNVEARDVTLESSDVASLEVASLRARLILEGQPLEDFACVPCARIVECRTDRQVVLDDRFMPSVLNVRACPPLAGFQNELLGMLRQHGDALARQAVATSRGGVAEIEDFLKLMLVNRYEPLVQHLVSAQLVHPEDLFRLLLMMAGELATLAERRRPAGVPSYQHDDLRVAFEPLMHTVRSLLPGVSMRVAPIPVEQRDKGLFYAPVPDASLWDGATFVLAARADRPGDDIRRDFPGLATLAAAPRLKGLVDGLEPGLRLVPLPSVPPQIPFYAGSVYFEIDRTGPEWRFMKEAAAFGLFVSHAHTFPNLKVELWALRG